MRGQCEAEVRPLKVTLHFLWGWAHCPCPFRGRWAISHLCCPSLCVPYSIGQVLLSCIFQPWVRNCCDMGIRQLWLLPSWSSERSQGQGQARTGEWVRGGQVFPFKSYSSVNGALCLCFSAVTQALVQIAPRNPPSSEPHPDITFWQVLPWLPHLKSQTPHSSQLLLNPFLPLFSISWITCRYDFHSTSFFVLSSPSMEWRALCMRRLPSAL
jgi:hypothetical protein